MKLRFERFEGLTSFTIRGEITQGEIKILQVGLESIVRDLDCPLVVNMVQTTLPTGLDSILVILKKSLLNQTKFKVHWISPLKPIGDFPSLNAFTSRLTGFKLRQVGERLLLDDSVHSLTEEFLALQKKLADLIGGEEKAHEIILRHHTLKQQESILKETLKSQRERMKLQVAVPSLNRDTAEKLTVVVEELKKNYGADLKI